jgi:hypothetical protein
MKRLSFQSKTIFPKNQSIPQANSGLTMSTLMSTLTQSSLDDAINKLRYENAITIENLRTKIRNDVQSMESRIAAAVIQAVRTTQNDQMETGSQTSMDTNTTTRTFADRFDALTVVVQNLAAQVSALAEAHESNINKRKRDLDKSTRRLLPPTTKTSRQPARSPPAKLLRARAPSPPTTPPPNGYPKNNGAWEGE